mgnify:FL=1
MDPDSYRNFVVHHDNPTEVIAQYQDNGEIDHVSDSASDSELAEEDKVADEQSGNKEDGMQQKSNEEEEEEDSEEETNDLSEQFAFFEEKLHITPALRPMHF